MKDDKTEFTTVDENGNKVTYEILFTYESTDTGKRYVGYTDNTEDEEGCTRVYASVFEDGEDGPVLTPITTDGEWEMIEKILEKIQEGETDG